MKRVICVVLALAAASCEPIDEDATETTVSAVRPRSTFTRYVPLAPAGPRVVPWTPGMALVPRGYAPRSFWVVYAGKERTTSTVEAAGFDIDAGVVLFSVELDARDMTQFITETNDTIQLLGLTGVGHGIAGNVTIKCCKVPGTHFFEWAWGTAYVMHEANEALYQ